MDKLKPNFNHPDLFLLFDSYSELVLYDKILQYTKFGDKFVHTEKSRRDLSTLLLMSEINIKILLRNMEANGVFNKGKRGIYFFRNDLIQ